MLQVRKRDGRVVDFDQQRIRNALEKAYNAVISKDGSNVLPDKDSTLQNITNDVCSVITSETHDDTIVNIEHIQDLVETALIKFNLPIMAKEYILYRKQRSDFRQAHRKIEQVIKDLAFGNSEDNDDKRENANINADATIA